MKIWRRAPLAALLAGGTLLTLFVATPLAAQELDGLAVAAALEQAFTRATEQAERSVVSIARIRPVVVDREAERRQQALFPPFQQRNPDNLNDPTNPRFVPQDWGSGVIIDVDKSAGPGGTKRYAYILTNYHVVKGGPIEWDPLEFGLRQTDGPAEQDVRLHVRLHNRRGYEARIHAADPRSDLAIIVIETTEVEPIKVGDASQLKKGQFVLALGNPYALARDGSASVSWGIISNVSRPAEAPVSKAGTVIVEEETIHHLGNLLQVDTRLNLGTSGGALLNLKGEMIGLTTSLAALLGYEKSAGYAVPMDEATRRIIQSLRDGLEVEYGFLGVQLSNVETIDEGRGRLPSGAQIQKVFPNSPAFRGRVESSDYVVAVNDAPIYSAVDLTREVGKHAPGETVRLTIYRDRQADPVTREVQLGKWPVTDDQGIIAVRRRHEPWRGLTIDYPTARQRFTQLYPGDNYPPGVLVLEVDPDRAGAKADLAAGNLIGQVNGRAVTTPAEFHEAVRGLTGDVTLTVLESTPGGFRGRPAVVRAP